MLYTGQWFPPVATQIKRNINSVFSPHPGLLGGFFITVLQCGPLCLPLTWPPHPVQLSRLAVCELCLDDIRCVGAFAQDVFNRHSNDKDKPPEMVNSGLVNTSGSGGLWCIENTAWNSHLCYPFLQIIKICWTSTGLHGKRMPWLERWQSLSVSLSTHNTGPDWTSSTTI